MTLRVKRIYSREDVIMEKSEKTMEEKKIQ